MRLTHTRQADLNLLIALAVLLEERKISTAADRFLNGAFAPAPRRGFEPIGSVSLMGETPKTALHRYFLSQSAMSRSLQRLRILFGDELLVKTKEGYELTLRAKQIQSELSEILPRLEIMLRGGNFNPAIAEDCFIIACTDYAAIIMGQPLFRSFYSQAPHASLNIESWYDEAFDDCQKGKLDLIMWVNAVPQPLVSQVLFEEEFVCVLAQDNPLCQKELTLHEFLNCSHVVVNVEKGQQTLIERKLEELGVTRKPALRVPYFGAAIHAVQQTLLVATVPQRIAKSYSNYLDIKVVQAPIELDRFRYIMAWHPRLSEDKAHCWLRNTIEQCAISLGK